MIYLIFDMIIFKTWKGFYLVHFRWKEKFQASILVLFFKIENVPIMQFFAYKMNQDPIISMQFELMCSKKWW